METEFVSEVADAKLTAKFVLHDYVDDGVRRITVDRDPETVLRVIRESDVYVHEVGHNIETRVMVLPESHRPVSVSVWPTNDDDPREHDIEDYFSGPGEDDHGQSRHRKQKEKKTALLFHPYLEDRKEAVDAAAERLATLIESRTSPGDSA